MEPSLGILVELGSQGIVDPRTPALFLECGENRFLIGGRHFEFLDDHPPDAKLLTIRIPGRRDSVRLAVSGDVPHVSDRMLGLRRLSLGLRAQEFGAAGHPPVGNDKARAFGQREVRARLKDSTIRIRSRHLAGVFRQAFSDKPAAFVGCQSRAQECRNFNRELP